MVAATLTVVLVCVLFWAVYRFQYAMFMLLAAMMLRVAIKPAFEWLRARGMRANLSVLVVFGGLFTLLIGLGALVAPLLAEQIVSLAIRLPQYYADLRTMLIQSPGAALQQLGSTLPNDWVTLLPQWNLNAIRQSAALDSVAPAAGFIASLGYGSFLLVATVMMTVYWTLDADRVTRAVLMHAPQERRDGWRALIAEVEGKVGGYFRGQLILCGFIFALSTAAYLLMGLPYALVLGIIAGLLEALPMIGPLLGMLPALLIALATAPEQAIWVIVAAIVIQQLENNLLVPRVMDKSVGINPVISILAIAAFSLLFGLVGAMLAIPVAAMLQILIGRVLFNSSDHLDERATQQAATPPSRSRLTMLRLEARELADDVRKQVRAESQTNDALSEPAQEPIDIIEDQLETMARHLDELLSQAEAARQLHQTEAAPARPRARGMA